MQSLKYVMFFTRGKKSLDFDQKFSEVFTLYFQRLYIEPLRHKPIVTRADVMRHSSRRVFKNPKNAHVIVQIQLELTLSPGSSQMCHPG